MSDMPRGKGVLLETLGGGVLAALVLQILTRFQTKKM